MRLAARFRMLLRSLFKRRRVEAELDEEIRAHLEQETDENIKRGMTPEQAALRARRMLGSASLYKEECRDARATSFVETLARDLRYALRTLRRTPLFTAAAIVTLALAIGANTTVFTFVENILLRPLLVRNPEQLVSLNWGGMVNISYPNYLDFRDRNTTFSSLAAIRLISLNLSRREHENDNAWGYEASGNYFQMLGIRPQLGRFFTPAEDVKPGANPVLVISHSYWKSRFHSDPGVLGRVVRLGGYPFTIIGVAPPGFHGTELVIACDFWVPISMEIEAEAGHDWLHSRMAQNAWLLGRLNPGASRAQAETDLNRIAAQLAGDYPNQLDPKAKFHLSKPGLVGQALRRPIAGFGAVLTLIAALGLLLACINLAGMLLARASDRSREIGIRLALGAGRLQLLRQLLTESALLVIPGALLGLTLAIAVCRLFSSWHLTATLPLDTTLHPNASILYFTFALAGLTVLLCGLGPALHATRIDLIPNLKGRPGETRTRRWQTRDLLVGAQIALSLVLVVSSVLVVRSLQHALSLNLGFDPEHAVSISFDLRSRTYTPQHSRDFDASLLEKAKSIPSFDAVGIINMMPLQTGENNSTICRADRPVPPPAERRAAIVYNISPGYLAAAGTRLLAGRDFNLHDREHSPRVGLVNQALVDLLFPKENPLGRHVRLSTDPADKGFAIVGVVETGKYEYLGEDPHPVVFRPIGQSSTDWTTLIARTHLPAQTATELLRKASLDLNPELSFFNVGSLKDQLALPLFPARAAAIVLGSLGAFAMLLAATGLFASMAYAVSRRKREIGIRMALGAKPRQVLSAVLKRTLIICAAGLTIGTVITLAAARLLSFVLYGISPRDPLTYVSALLLMLAVAIAACFHPALRAIHIDPARTLREQ